MSNLQTSTKPATPSGGWSDLWKKEDWWAVWIGLGIVLAAIILWSMGSTLKPLAISFPKYDDFSKVTDYITSHVGGYLALFVLFTVVFTFAAKILGHKVSEFIPGFIFIFIMATIIQIIGAWSLAQKYYLEPPVLALIVGMLISNTMKLPQWMGASLRTEFYVKTGIVLLGATLPFTAIVQAGPMAFGQATFIAVTTFLTIYWVGVKLGLDRRFATCLAAGGSICGVSASIAIGGSVKAEKEHVSVAISLVVIWAIIMVMVLPVLIKTFGIPDGPAGAWIGTSEFADAAGMAAAATISDQAINTFTLMKVVGRDMFIGIWCFIMAFISVTRWEKSDTGSKPDAKVIWNRFPKFVLGFFIASAILTLLITSVTPEVSKEISSTIISPVKTLRTWAFTLCFFSIGLTTRFKELTSVGWKPIAAFTAGVAVNVPLGFIMSVLILGSYWSSVQ